MKRIHLSRRHMLRATSSVALGLPLLEAMHNVAHGQPMAEPPRRYVTMFGGVTTGPLGRIQPAKTGAGYALTSPLTALAPMQDAFSVVTGLRVPQMGAGGWGAVENNWHGATLGPLMCGVSGTGRAGGGHADAVARGVTSDQLVANKIAGTTPLRSLELRVQPDVYRENDNTYGVMSYRAGAKPTDKLIANQPYSSPKLAWQALMTGFVPPNGMEDPALVATRVQRKSVLDLVKAQSDRLQARLGTADRTRLQRHFDEVRDLEKRVSSQMGPILAPACKAIGDPGDDPPTKFVDYGNQFGPAGFSSEDKRGPLMMDLMHMALTCDRTRVGTVLLSFIQCFIAVQPLLGITDGGDLHGTGHSDNESGNAKVIGWHVGLMAYLAKKLRETPEEGTDGGKNVLDRTVLILHFEGGFAGDPHSGENMVSVIGGGLVGPRKLQHGKHYKVDGLHPCALNVSGMSYAMNEDVSALGEVKGGVPGLTA
jgi:hypothetical protein